MDNYNNIIIEIEKLRKPRVEKNVFAIGGRGHYENPISDILAFFIHPWEEHGFGVLFLQSLFQAANIQPPVLELIESPDREKSTHKGNRIDLIAEGDSWVLVIENKVRHEAVNPFKDYMKYIESTYKGKTPYYILLSVQNEKPPIGWSSATWGTYIEYLKKNIGTYLTLVKNAKWHVIVREFILNIESEYGDNSMSEERIEFVKNNYESIQEINDMLSEYVSYMTEKGMDAINSASINEKCVASSKRHNWREKGIALRLISTVWGGNTNITLLLKRDGLIVIQLYIYDIADPRVSALRKYIDESKYKKYWSEQKTIRCFGFFQESDHLRMFDEVLDVAKRLNDFYSTAGNNET